MSRCEPPSGPCPWPRCACSSPCPTCPTPWVSLDGVAGDDDCDDDDREADEAALEREAELDRDCDDDPLDWPDVDGDEERRCGFPHCDCTCPCKLWEGVWADPEIDELVCDSGPIHEDDPFVRFLRRLHGVGSATPDGEASLSRDPAESNPVGSDPRESE